LSENNSLPDQGASLITPSTEIPVLANQLHENGNDYPETVIPVPEVDESIPELIPAGEDEDDQDQDQEMDEEPDDDKPGKYSPPPGIEDARRAYEDLQKILKPKQKKGPGHVDPGLDPLTHEWLEQMCQFLWNYVDPKTTAHGGTSRSSWVTASEQTAHALGKGNYLARTLRKWCRAFIFVTLISKPSGHWRKSQDD
jgi:hypothetical protein